MPCNSPSNVEGVFPPCDEARGPWCGPCIFVVGTFESGDVSMTHSLYNRQHCQEVHCVQYLLLYFFVHGLQNTPYRRFFFQYHLVTLTLQDYSSLRAKQSGIFIVIFPPPPPHLPSVWRPCRDFLVPLFDRCVSCYPPCCRVVIVVAVVACCRCWYCRCRRRPCLCDNLLSPLMVEVGGGKVEVVVVV